MAIYSARARARTVTITKGEADHIHLVHRPCTAFSIDDVHGRGSGPERVPRAAKTRETEHEGPGVRSLDIARVAHRTDGAKLCRDKGMHKTRCGVVRQNCVPYFPCWRCQCVMTASGVPAVGNRGRRGESVSLRASGSGQWAKSGVGLANSIGRLGPRINRGRLGASQRPRVMLRLHAKIISNLLPQGYHCEKRSLGSRTDRQRERTRRSTIRTRSRQRIRPLPPQLTISTIYCRLLLPCTTPLINLPRSSQITTRIHPLCHPNYSSFHHPLCPASTRFRLSPPFANCSFFNH